MQFHDFHDLSWYFFLELYDFVTEYKYVGLYFKTVTASTTTAAWSIGLTTL